MASSTPASIRLNGLDLLNSNLDGLRARCLELDDFFFRFSALDFVRLGAKRVLDKIQFVRGCIAPFAGGMIPAASEEWSKRRQTGANDGHVHLDVRPRGSTVVGI